MRPNKQPKRKIIPPVNGWEERTLYKVRVAYCKGNPIHTALFYSGFLYRGEPEGYNCIWNPSYDGERYSISSAYYLEVIEKLNVDFHDPVETIKD